MTTSQQHTSDFLQRLISIFRVSFLLCVVTPLLIYVNIMSGAVGVSFTVIACSVFLISLIACAIVTVNIFQTRSAATHRLLFVSAAVIILIPVLSLSLLMFLKQTGQFLSDYRIKIDPATFNPWYDLNDHSGKSSTGSTSIMFSEMPTPLPTNTPRPALDFSAQGVLINRLNTPAMYHRSISGLVFKPTANFTSTFVGNKQVIVRLVNLYTGERVAVEAIYTDTCADNWRDGKNKDLRLLTQVVANIINSESPMRDARFECVGLQLSAPLKIGDTYIGIEPNKNGSPVELAELPQLLNVIENARPMLPISKP